MAIGDERLATIFELRAAGQSEVNRLLSNVGGTMEDLEQTAASLRKGLGKLGDLDQVEAGVRRLGAGFESAQGSGERLQGGVGSLGGVGFAKLAVGVGLATVAMREFIDIGQAAFAFAQSGAAALDVADAFERLGGTAAELEALNAATASYADTTTLQTILNMADAYGLTNAQVELLGAGVVAMGQATGKSQEEIRRSLTTTIQGFGKFSDEALAGLGLTLAQVNDELARTVPGFKDLGAAQQLAAKQTAALALVTAKDLTPSLDTAGAQFANTQTTIDNFMSDLQTFAAELFISTGALDSIKDATEQFAGMLDENQDAIKQLANEGLALLIELMPVILDTMTKLSPVLALVSPAMTLVEDAFRRSLAPIDIFIGHIKIFTGVLGAAISGAIWPFIKAAESVADALGLDIADALGDASDALEDFVESSLDRATEGVGQFAQGVVNSTAVLSIAVRETENAIDSTSSYGAALSDTTAITEGLTDATRDLTDATIAQIIAQSSAEDLAPAFTTAEATDRINEASSVLGDMMELEKEFSERVSDFGTAGVRGDIDRLLSDAFALSDAVGVLGAAGRDIGPISVTQVGKVEAKIDALLELDRQLVKIEEDATSSGGGGGSRRASAAKTDPITAEQLFALMTGMTTDRAAEAFVSQTEDFIALAQAIIDAKELSFEIKGRATILGVERAGEAFAGLKQGPETDAVREQAGAIQEELAAADAAETAAEIDELTASMQGLVATISGTGDGDSAAIALAQFAESMASTSAEISTQMALIEEGGNSAGSALKGGLGIAKAGIGAFAGSVIKDTKALAVIQGLFEVAEAGAAIARFIGSYGADGVQLASFGAHTLAAAAYFKAAGGGGGGGSSSARGAAGAAKKPQQTFNETGDSPLLARADPAKLAPVFIVNQVTLSTEQVANSLNDLASQDRNIKLSSNLISDQPSQPRF